MTTKPTRLQDMAGGRRDVLMMDPSILIRDDGWNARIAGPELDAHIRWLADSIKAEGLKEPLTIYLKDGAAHITNGFCRHTAIMLARSEGAEIPLVACQPEPRGADETDRVLGMFIRNSGKPLTPLEQSVVFSRLIKLGLDVPKIAERAGISKTHVTNMLDLAAAPAPVKALVAVGTVSATLATDTLRAEGETAGAETLKNAATAATAAGKTKVARRDVIKPPAPAKPRHEPDTAPPAPAAVTAPAWPPTAAPAPATASPGAKRMADALAEIAETLETAANAGQGLRQAQVTHLLTLARKALPTVSTDRKAA